MGNIFTDSFEANNFDLWTSNIFVTIDQDVAGMDAGKCLNFNSNMAAQLVKGIGSPVNEIWVAFDFMPSNIAYSYGSILAFMLGGLAGSHLLQLHAEGDEVGQPVYLALWGGGDDLWTIEENYINGLTPGTKYRIQVRFRPDGANGIVQVMVDGILVIDYAGPIASGHQISETTLDTVVFGWTIPGYGSRAKMFIDNVLFDDAEWPDDGSGGEDEEVGYLSTGGGVVVGGEVLFTSNRVYALAETYPVEPTVSLGGISVGGEVEPVFISPVTFVAEVTGGLLVGGAVIPSLVVPTPYRVTIRGGLSVGGRPRPVFVSPTASILAGTLFTATVQGGVLVGGAPVAVVISPSTFVVVVSGGVKVSGPPFAQVKFVTPSDSGVSAISTRGGVEISGSPVPVFVTPPVHRVQVDPRIIASIMVGGGGGAVFITPQVFVQTVEGDIIVASESELGQDEVYETWALNGKNNEPAIFSGFKFNSFAIHNGVPYGAGEDGLFVLKGESDDGALIHPGVRFGPMNFGMDCQKRLRVINIGKAGAQTKVRVEVVDGGDRIFTPKRDPRRVPIDRDLQGEDFYVDVSDFVELSHIEIIPLILFRK